MQDLINDSNKLNKSKSALESLTIQGTLVSLISVILYIVTGTNFKNMYFNQACNVNQASNLVDIEKLDTSQRSCINNYQNIKGILDDLTVVLGLGGFSLSFAGRTRKGDIWTPRFVPGPDREVVENRPEFRLDQETDFTSGVIFDDQGHKL